MKIATVQLVPVFGDIEGSIAKIERMISGIVPGAIDLLLLPELALAGYNFPSLRDIKPYLEVQGAGPSSLWAQKTAKRLKCIVSIGYPEKAHPPTAPGVAARKTKPSGLDKRYNYNSNIMYGPSGTMVGHYRKNFLFMTDLTWCSEPSNHLGNGEFFAENMPAPLDKKMALGICMDINPYKFSAPFESYEFSSHARDSGAEVAAICMAWTSLILTPEDVLGKGKDQPDLETLDYWIKRFQPVVGGDRSVIMVMGNRCGVEGNEVYAGSSMIARVGKGNVEVYDVLGKGEERALIVDTEKTPKHVWDKERKMLLRFA